MKKSLFVIFLSTLSLSIAGCGGGSSDSNTKTPHSHSITPLEYTGSTDPAVFSDDNVEAIGHNAVKTLAVLKAFQYGSLVSLDFVSDLVEDACFSGTDDRNGINGAFVNCSYDYNGEYTFSAVLSDIFDAHKDVWYDKLTFNAVSLALDGSKLMTNAHYYLEELYIETGNIEDITQFAELTLSGQRYQFHSRETITEQEDWSVESTTEDTTVNATGTVFKFDIDDNDSAQYRAWNDELNIDKLYDAEFGYYKVTSNALNICENLASPGLFTSNNETITLTATDGKIIKIKLHGCDIEPSFELES